MLLLDVDSTDSVFQSTTLENCSLKSTKLNKVIDVSGILLGVATTFLMGYYA